MKTAILTIGTEILFGQITNTNSVFISQQLQLLGYDVMYHHTVGDNPERLRVLIDQIFKDCDLIITTGGLGPTQDDLSKETVCEALHDEMVPNEEQIEILKATFAKLGREMTENNLKQAYFPSRAIIFPNDVGTAPGFALSENGKTVICMPGPPREMTRMFELQVKPFLCSMQDSVIFYRMIKTYGIGESQMETVLLPLINEQSDPTLATYAKDGECSLRIASKRKTVEEAQVAVDEMLEKVKEIIGEYIYSCEDESLSQVVAKKLIEKNMTISCAESCTGGLFASSLTDNSGISKVFDRCFVTYSNEAKMQELGVSSETLEKYGAVSEETALEMVRGVKKATGSDVCISVTGIAGPDGGTEEKPVGLSYVGAICGDKEFVKTVKVRNHNRKYVKDCTVLAMLDVVNSCLK